MGSTRLPGKVLADVCGKPMLLWQVERIRKCRLVDQVVIATTVSEGDNKIEKFCLEQGIDYYRGHEGDVLKRVTSLVRDIKVDLHVELCGDTPLIDPQIIDEFVGYYIKNKKNLDFLSSAPKTTYPPGFEVTVYPKQILLEVDNLIGRNDPMREHVGYNITRFPERFRLHILEAPEWLTAPEIYLEVDTSEDLDLIRKIVGNFKSRKQEHFGLSEILNFLKDYPSLAKKNADIKRRWKSLYSNV